MHRFKNKLTSVCTWWCCVLRMMDAPLPQDAVSCAGDERKPTCEYPLHARQTLSSIHEAGGIITPILKMRRTGFQSLGNLFGSHTSCGSEIWAHICSSPKLITISLYICSLCSRERKVLGRSFCLWAWIHLWFSKEVHFFLQWNTFSLSSTLEQDSSCGAMESTGHTSYFKWLTWQTLLGAAVYYSVGGTVRDMYTLQSNVLYSDGKARVYNGGQSVTQNFKWGFHELI